MPAAFAIIHTWPDLRNAEYEVVQRLLAAAANVGRPVILVDNGGSIVWASPELNLRRGQILPSDAAEFVLSLHFESPRTLDIYSYYAIWQPTEFYFDFGYQRSIDRFSTHNDLLSCDSDIGDAHALNIYGALGRKPLAPLPKLFHMVAEPYLEPNISEDSKLFYIGINWERVGRPKGRFHDALVGLDEKGLTTIYGPELIMGVAPWQGFKTYAGELPFDGHSVKRAINRAGICLALSSAQHKRTGIMSNRLFEGLAGGAAVIATPNPIIDKHFRDVVYLVDDSRGEDVLGQMTLEAVREIRADTAEARRRVLEGQRILREICSLERSIEHLFENNGARKAHFEQTFLADAEVTVILMDDYAIPELIGKRLDEYRAQKRGTIDLHIVCDRAIAAELAGQGPGGAVRSLTIHGCDFNPTAGTLDGIAPPRQRTGPVVWDILQSLTTPAFMIAGTNESVFTDHLASLAKALESDPAATMACSGALREAFNGPVERVRSFIELRHEALDALALANGPAHRGRFLYRSSLIDMSLDDLFIMLDGEEYRCFQVAGLLEGRVAQTGYASYILDEAAPPRMVSTPVEFQRQVIRDKAAHDPRWLQRLGVAKKSDLVFVHSSDGAIRTADFAPTSALRMKLGVGRMVATVFGGEGASYLGLGFSQPENEHTWLSSTRGIIDFALQGAGEEELDVALVMLGRRSASGREQHCTIIVNGMSCAYLPIPEAITEVKVRIPRNLIHSSSEFRIELLPDHVEPANSEAGVNDPRHLAIALHAFGVMPQAKVPLPILQPDMLHGCGVRGAGFDALVRGFYEAEPDLTWMAGTSAAIRFRLSRLLRRPVLRMGLWGRRSSEGDRQIVRLMLNKQRLPDIVLEDRQDIVDIALDEAAPIGSQYNLEVRLLHAETAKDGNGRLIDGRLLGMAVTGIGVFEEDPLEPDDALLLEDVDAEEPCDDDLF